MSASKTHIRWLQFQIKKLYGISGKINPAPRAWVLVYAKNASKKLLHLIYHRKKIPFLQRKRQRVKNYL